MRASSWLHFPMLPPEGGSTTGDWLEATCHAKPDRVRVGIGRDLVAMAAREHAHVGDEPAPAAHDAQVAGRRTGGVACRRGRVVARVVPVVHPFPDVAGHVEE